VSGAAPNRVVRVEWKGGYERWGDEYQTNLPESEVSITALEIFDRNTYMTYLENIKRSGCLGQGNYPDLEYRESKIAANLFFAKACLEDRYGNVRNEQQLQGMNLFYLEASPMLTTKILNERGLKLCSKFIANDDAAVCNTMRERAKTEGMHGVQIHHARVGDYIQQRSNQTATGGLLHGCFFDYMGSFIGNKTKGMSPQEDVRTFFTTQQAADECVLAVTHAPRNVAVECKGDTSTAIIRWIQDISNEFGFYCRLEKQFPYKSVTFIMLRLIKHTPLRS
jgi:hypothetical protein